MADSSRVGSRSLAWMALALVTAGLGLGLTACQPAEQVQADEVEQVAEAPQPGLATVVFLVRHAEKATENPQDPELTPEGADRADLLAHMLSDAGVDHVWSTDTKRTRNTAIPIAELAGVDVRLYDPRDLPRLAAQMTTQGGRHVVVGHSNTTPAAVGALGGEPGAPIEEATEYDRLYQVTVGPDGHVSTVLMRFGAGPHP